MPNVKQGPISAKTKILLSLYCRSWVLNSDVRHACDIHDNRFYRIMKDLIKEGYVKKRREYRDHIIGGPIVWYRLTHEGFELIASIHTLLENQERDQCNANY